MFTQDLKKRRQRTCTHSFFRLLTHTDAVKHTKTDRQLQTYCSFWRNAAWRVSPILLPLRERNVIWQTNVVTDILSGAFYGLSMLLVTPPPPPPCPPPPPVMKHMKVDLPYLLLSFPLILKSFPLCIIPECVDLFKDQAEQCFKELWSIMAPHCFSAINMPTTRRHFLPK